MSDDPDQPTNGELRSRLLALAHNMTQRSNSQLLHSALDRINDLTEALEAARSVRPENWDDDEDPEQVEAWELVEAALQRTRNAP